MSELETRITQMASAHLPTAYGEFQIDVFQEEATGHEHVTLRYGVLSPEVPLLVRVHSECLTGESFSSLKCDCQWQLQRALQLISERGSGMLVYLKEEGRGIGLINKIRAYHLQDEGLDTVEANLALGLAVDMRNYQVAADMLAYFGIQRIELLTNNPEKVRLLSEKGIEVVQRIAIEQPPNKFSAEYLKVKKEKLGHLLTVV